MARRPARAAAPRARKNNVSEIDLEGMSIPELRSLIDEAESMIKHRSVEARRALIVETQEKARHLGLSLEELLRERSPRGRRTGPVAAKYRSPTGETWSGRGRPPRWLVAAEAAGKKRDEFAV